MSHDPSMTGNDSAVVVLSNDLFFAMRIQSALTAMQYRCTVTKSPDEFEDAVRAGGFVLALVDFNHPLDWKRLASVIAASDHPTLAFGPHKDTDGFAAARAAGADRVVANGVFTTHMPELVKKYARRSS